MAVTGHGGSGTLGHPLLEVTAARDSRALLAAGRDGTHRYDAAGGCDPGTADVTVLRR
jgi:hypothetical protein